MEMLAAPVKRASEVDLVRGMKRIISSAYSSSDSPADHEEAIQELSKMRTAAITRCFDRVESSLEPLYQYYDQLVALDSKIVSSEVIIYFKWKDALAGSSWLSGRQSLSVASFGYERACVLFNIGALQSQIAASQSLTDDAGLKQAARLMQQSANSFAQLGTFAAAAVADHQPTTDLQLDALHALSRLMLAQAQEAFVLKAVRDQMKPSLAARLSAQCADYFGEAARALRDSSRCAWDKEWLSMVQAKRHAYAGFAEFYASQLCNADKKAGAEISRLQQAEKEVQAALSRVPACEAWTALAARVKVALAAAVKDNNFIYHEIVPEHSTLETIDKMAVAKISALPAPLCGGACRDLFADLTPVSVQQAMAGYEVRRSALVNTHVARLRDATQTLNGVLASLNLPAAIEDSSSTALPPSIQQKAAAVREAGGASAVQGMVDELPTLLQRNTEILNETERLLNEEQSSDQQMRDQFKSKWTRTPSDKLTESFRTNCAKYRQLVNNAVQADRVVREKFDGCRSALLLLAGSDASIVAHLARADRGGTEGTTVAAASSASNRLHSLMDRVVALKSQRDQLESQLKAATTDLKATFMNALQQQQSDSAGGIDQLVSSTYDPLVSRVGESLQQQEQLVAEIQRANDEFVREQGSSAGSARASELKQLASAHDVFIELRANLKEGSKFYNDLTQVLLTFQSKVSDYCFARKTEKEELLKDLTSSLANQNTTPAPEVPSHVQQAASAPGVNSAGGAGTAAGSALPYPVQSQMPLPFMPYFTPMPMSYNPYGTYPGAQQQPQQQQFYYPPAYPGYPASSQQRPPGQ